MSTAACPNCGSLLREADRFCPSCGQQVIGQESLGSFFEQFMGDYFTFDSKIMRSLVPLLVRPGWLTLEYLRGRRASYIPPLRMFIFLSVIFFLIFGWSASGGETSGVTVDELQDRVKWDNFFASVLPKLFFIFLPLFALLVHLFYRDRPANFIKPFILSAHFHAFVFMAFTIYGLLSRFFAARGLVMVNQILIALVIFYAVIYLSISLRRVFPRPIGMHTMKFTMLLCLYVVLMSSGAVLAVWWMDR
jgi:hypothetical protein